MLCTKPALVCEGHGRKMLFEAQALKPWILPAVHILLCRSREKPDWAVAVWALYMYRSPFFLWNILSSYYCANKTHLGILNCFLLREDRIEVSQSFGCSYTDTQQITHSFPLFVKLSPNVIFCHRPLNSLWVISYGRRWPWRTRQLLTTGTAASLLLDRLGQLWGLSRLRNLVRFCLAHVSEWGNLWTVFWEDPSFTRGFVIS